VRGGNAEPRLYRRHRAGGMRAAPLPQVWAEYRWLARQIPDVVRGREFLGELEDIRVEPDGGASTVVVATEHGSEALDYGDDVKLVPTGSRVRAAS